MSQHIMNGDSAEILKTIKSNTIDAVITDPPYGIEFLAKDWDRNTGAVEIWQVDSCWPFRRRGPTTNWPPT